MLDLKLLREQPEHIHEALKKRGSSFNLDALLTLEKARRELLVSIETDRHALKGRSETFGRACAAARQAGRQKESKPLAPPPELKKLSEAIKQREQKLNAMEEKIQHHLAYLPNIPHSSVPVGDATANQVVRTVGEKPQLSFPPKTYLELSERLGLIDFPRAAKITGSHFPLYCGMGARLERTLCSWMLDVHTKEHGYREIFPPFLVNRDSMFGTGQIPKFEEDMYRLKDDDLFLIPTAEVPVTNLHRDDILEESQLPLNYTAYTACFRREAGSYGKDTKGLIRVHQFDKVELVKFATPQTSYQEHERLVGHAETILRRLGLHYRVVCLSTGDLGFAAAKCYDLEAWAPGLGQYLEVSSCSNFEDFQARRANIRYRPACAAGAVGRQAASKKLAYVHTLNGSGVALARTLICLLETHQQPDGRVGIPDVLRPYLDGQTSLEGPAPR